MTQNTIESTPQTKYLKNYQPSNFLIESVYLTFYLEPEATRVVNVMKMVSQRKETELELMGEHLQLLSVRKNGQLLSEEHYRQSATTLTLPASETTFELEIETLVNPQANTRLEGLYRSSGNYCTQCEAEGFRTITYYLDRPDVMSYFTTKIVGSKHDNKVLLSNGNLIEAGDIDEELHYAIWEDPFKKPCYLFALVAGNLEVLEDHFVTKDGRRIDLRIYVQTQNLDKTEHAMASLKHSMKWDEDRFGLIYDLDIYMIVAVDDFNMGAMENKGLNVFNSKFVLANPETATDVDYEGIEAVIGHEYFHNWTGNRVTCRDWFQLTLKEGLTVFRDQEFTADRLSPTVKRIEDVKRLRSFQFPEDAGPMAHPIQPQSYIEMNNFYTMTVYEKGAEVIRLYHTLLGEEGFRKGMDLYFERFDGQAVTVEDFRSAMADANQRNLDQLHHWYIQSGTPVIKVVQQFDETTQTLELQFEQYLNQQQQHLPLLIPVKFGFLSENGAPLSLELKTGDDCVVDSSGWIFEMREMRQCLVFKNVNSRPILSLLRGFSAPVFLEYHASEAELAILASYDSDSFVRWESMQTLALMNLVQNITAYGKQEPLQLMPAYQQAFDALLDDVDLDLSLKALAMELPDKSYVIEHLSEKGLAVDVSAIEVAHKHMTNEIAENSHQQLFKQYQSLNQLESYRYCKEDKAKRMLKNRCLNYLAVLDAYQSLAVEQYYAQNNMTDVSAALASMKPFESEAKTACFENFYQKWSSDPLVLDKWFAFQAADTSGDVLSRIQNLLSHKDFSYTNPNRVRSVLGVFGRMNLIGFHQPDGAGYELMVREILKLDKINPQVAARIVAPFTQWKKFDENRQIQMKSSLETLSKHNGLSKDVFEIVSKSLA